MKKLLLVIAFLIIGCQGEGFEIEPNDETGVPDVMIPEMDIPEPLEEPEVPTTG